MSKNNYEVGKDGSSNKNTSRGPGGGRGHGDMSFEKPKNFKESIGKLFNYCKKYKPAVIVSIVLAILGSVITIISPKFIETITNLITDGMMTGINLDLITSMGILVLVLSIVSWIFSYGQGFVMATVTQRVARGLRNDLSCKINRIPLKYFDNNTYGDILSRITNDVDTLADTMNQSVSEIISGSVLLIGSALMMFVTNWLLAILAILASLIGIALTGIIIAKSQKFFAKRQSALGELNGHIEEVYAGHNVVRTYNGEAGAKATFDKMNKTLRDASWKAQFISGLMIPLMGFIGNLGYVVVCVGGGALVFSGKMEFGVIVAFMIYIRLFTQPLAHLSQALTQLQSTAAASERVFEFLNEKEQSLDLGEANLKNINGDIEFDHVKFGYDQDRMIIKDFSFQAKGGEKIAIVGPTGAGKTTLVNLLMRFYEINEGDIKIDRVPISNISRSNIRKLFGMVLQDTWIFEGSIIENIKYSKETATVEDVVNACKAVGIHHFIKTLPQGYDTILTDSVNLSQGQKQLLTIARAMVEDAPMLILDEATSSVDTRTEVLIQKAMDKLMVGRTSFVIAHRLSTIKNADTILVMKDGDVIEEGSHNVLMDKDGFYKGLYNSQFENND